MEGNEVAIVPLLNAGCCWSDRYITSTVLGGYSQSANAATVCWTSLSSVLLVIAR